MVPQHHDTQTAVGSILGSIIGFGKGLFLMVQEASIISAESVIQTVVLSAIGAAVGFVITTLLKKLNEKIKGKG
jgi:hypothetical protein